MYSMIGNSHIATLLFAVSFLMIGGIFSFITAPFAAVANVIGGVVTAGKTKATAKINAANAAKQRAHEAKMAALAAQEAKAAQSSQVKMVQTLALAGGGILVAYFVFFKKKR